MAGINSIGGNSDNGNIPKISEESPKEKARRQKTLERIWKNNSSSYLGKPKLIGDLVFVSRYQDKPNIEIDGDMIIIDNEFKIEVQGDDVIIGGNTINFNDTKISSFSIPTYLEVDGDKIPVLRNGGNLYSCIDGKLLNVIHGNNNFEIN